MVDVKHKIGTMSILVHVRMFFLLIICSVHSLEAVPDFVSPAYDKGSDCFKLQFNSDVVKADCEAIQIQTGNDEFVYARITSTGEEAVYPGGKCGDSNITAKADDRGGVYVCGYPTDMCSEACFLNIFCQPKDPGVDAPPTKINVSEYMCSASQGAGGTSRGTTSIDSCDCTGTNDDCRELIMGVSLGTLLFISVVLNVILVLFIFRKNIHFCGRVKRQLYRINSVENSRA